MSIDAIRRWSQQARTSFPAGGLLLALLIGYFLFFKTGSTGPSSRNGGTAPAVWRDISGVKYRAQQYSRFPATVFFFLSSRCPCSDSYSRVVATLAAENPAVRFFAVFSNGDESIDEIRQYMQSRKLPLPAVKDENALLAEQLRAAATPSVVIIDAMKRVRYQGPIGEPLPGGTVATLEACQPFVQSLTAVLSGQNVEEPTAASFGCAIIGSTTDGLPPIEPNDNRSSAGLLENGVLKLRLVAQTGVWRPEKEDGAGLPMHAFQEEGKPLQAPGPLIRVPQGTQMRVSVRNAIPGATLYLRGLHAQPGNTNIVMTLPPGEEREFDWNAHEPGTYLYWASVKKKMVFDFPHGKDALLAGGFIVDPPDTSPDTRERIFILSMLVHMAPDFKLENFPNGVLRSVVTINGLTWPFTERLKYPLGECVRWRIINAGLAAHPMHLHGFYFEVTRRRDSIHEIHYPEEERELSVTELIYPTGSISLEWTPDRLGRWLFHCHMSAHVSSKRRLRGPGQGPQAEDEHTRHALEDMSGLVLGVEIEPGPGWQSPPEPASQPRQLTLHVREHPGPTGKKPIFSFFPQNDPEAPLPSVPIVPGLPLVLTRGERTQIKVINHTSQATAVHWHGIELESYHDGVVGWGGHARTVTPSIPPGGYFVAEMTPPRAGTFIYHTHFDDEHQLASGLYGPIIVMEPGERYDAEKDRLFIISEGAPDIGGVLLNGSFTPSTMQVKVGETYRFRFINITLNISILTVRLSSGGAPVAWRPVAKDGANLPPARTRMQPADQLITVGETRDFEFTPEKPGELRLSVVDETGKTVVALSLFAH